jgi:hypothetical protein
MTTDRSPTKGPTLLVDNNTISPDLIDCGHSAAEAHRKGCVFDVMLSTWVHEKCADLELMEQYLTVEKFRWFHDTSLKVEISDVQMRRGEHHRAYARLDYHPTHCVYVWEKQVRAYMGNRGIDYRIFSIEHTAHCAKLLAHHTGLTNVTEMTVSFGLCGTRGNSD